jgi:hypothetical protein
VQVAHLLAQRAEGKYMKAIIGIFLISLMVSCASKLPTKLVDNKPRGHGVLKMDLSKISFLDYQSGETVNLRQYMVDNGREYMLITFGSKGCSSCNEKSTELQQTVIGQHPLYLTDAGSKFEIRGISTDQGAYPTMASYLAQFPYIQWNDPAGLEMIENFMPAGAAFAVPLTAMITIKGEEGASWIIPPSEHVTVPEIMERVVETLGLNNNGNAVPTPVPTPTPVEPPVVTVPASPLDMPLAGRLKGIKVAGCDANGKSLDELFGDVDMKVLHVAKSCDENCISNMEQIRIFNTACAQKKRGKSCKGITLIEDAPAANLCSDNAIYQGGSEFFASQFKSLFNWNYEVSVAPDYTLSIDAVEGPLVFGFSKKGPISFTKDKLIASGDLETLVATSPEVNKGPDFPFYKKNAGVAEYVKFSEIRKQSRYTIVNIWSGGPPPCGSCIVELEHWSKPKGLIEFCDQNPSVCQFLSLEGFAPKVITDETLSDYYDQWTDGIVDGQGNVKFEGFKKLGITAEILLDPLSNAEDFPEFEFRHRFYNGYLQAIEPELYSDPRTVIYDREGKHLATYKTNLDPENEKDEVFLKIKELMQIEAELGSNQ